MINNTRNRFFIVVIAVLLITNLAMLYVFTTQRKGASHGGPQAKGRSGMSVFLKDKIKFNEQQLKSFDSLREKHHESLKPLFDSLKTAKRNYYAQLETGSYVDSLGQLVGNRQAAIERSFYQYFGKIRSMCDADQKSLFDKEFPAMVERMITPGRWQGGRLGGDSATQR
jgi:hypothetical protein